LFAWLKSYFMNYGYEFLDSGDGRRLDIFGGVTVDRPAPQAEWKKKLSPSAWQSDLFYDRAKDGKSGWAGEDRIPENWSLRYGGATLLLKPSPQSQIGVFPEQMPNWDWLTETLRAACRPLKILNCFAYTGGATLAASLAHTEKFPVEVCHLDASRSAVGWARRNAEASGLGSNPIRWIVEDVTRFLDREIRRSQRYDGFILDPPAFGRGKGKDTWVLKRDLPGLLERLEKLLSKRPRFVLLSGHAPELGPRDLASTLSFLGNASSFPLALHAKNGNDLPCGSCARWSET